MYLEYFKDESFGWDEDFYYLVKVMSLLENIDNIKLGEKKLIVFPKVEDFKSSMNDRQYKKMIAVDRELKLWRKEELANLTVSSSSFVDLALTVGFQDADNLIDSCIESVFNTYKHSTEFVNKKILNAIQENKISALSLGNELIIRDFLLTLPEFKSDLIDNLISSVEKKNLSVYTFVENKKKIFIFNLLLIFASKENLSEYTIKFLKVIFGKINLEVEYVDELFDAAKKVSNAIDYAEELIFE